MEARDIVGIVVGMIAAGGWIAVWRLWQRVRLLEGRVEPLEKAEADRRAGEERVSRVLAKAAALRRAATRRKA